MSADFGFISFDFDLTLTKQHTWNVCGLSSPLSEGDSQLGRIQYQDGALLIRLIRHLCSAGFIAAITSRQFGSTIFYSLKGLPGGQQMLTEFHGSRFFIFGRESLRMSKAQTLTDAFGANVGGLHFDDDIRENSGLSGNHHFCPMEEGKAFSLDCSSGLSRGLADIPFHFSGLLAADIDASYASLCPPPVKYPALAFGPASWKKSTSLSLTAFVADLRTALMLSEENPVTKRRGIVF